MSLRAEIPEFFTVDIHTAAKNNDMDAAAKFFEEGGDPNVRCRMKTIALHRAAFYGHIRMCEFLIKKGSDIEACDPHGQTPLFWASRAGHIEIIQLLLKSGAYIDAKDKKDRSSLFVAAYYGQVRAVSFLIEAGAKKNYLDNEGNEVGETYIDSVSSIDRAAIEALLR